MTTEAFCKSGCGWREEFDTNAGAKAAALDHEHPANIEDVPQ